MKMKWNDVFSLGGPSLFICALFMFFESRFSAEKIQPFFMIFGMVELLRKW